MLRMNLNPLTASRTFFFCRLPGVCCFGLLVDGFVAGL